MENTEGNSRTIELDEGIIHIGQSEYFHESIIALSGQSPEIAVLLQDILVLGICITELDIVHKVENKVLTSELVTNDLFKNGEMIVYKLCGHLVLLAGYDKYLKAQDSGKATVKVRLMSKPVLKKASTVVYVKPDPRDIERDNSRDTYRPRRFSSSSEHVAQPVQNKRPRPHTERPFTHATRKGN